MSFKTKLPIILILSIFLGSIVGLTLGEKTLALKPLGDLLLNLLFCAVIPLIFFSISSSVSEFSDLKEFGQIAGVMLIVFVITGIIASLLMVGAVLIFPPVVDLSQVTFNFEKTPQSEMSFLSRIVQAISVSDFRDLFSKNHILALIVFSLLTGIATSIIGEKGKKFSEFLKSGNDVVIQIVEIIMYYAPIGLFGYFAYLMGHMGASFLGIYGKALLIYYPVAIFYFFTAFSFYAWLSSGKNGTISFWKNIIPTALTALGTGSSVASIPLNLKAADKIGTPRKVSRVVIPLGATIHMDGSCLSAILKIALLHHIYGLSFVDPITIMGAIGIALLAGTVMSGVPGGGFLGEVLIVSLYGFPFEAVPIITMVGMLVDAPATMVNAVGDNVASMMVAKWTRKT